MSWTETRVELMRKDWSQGFSASEIAQKLGGVTRSAVLGKLHRLGVPKRRQANPTPDHIVRERIVKLRREHRRGRKPKLSTIAPSPVTPLNISIIDIRPDQCRAITDDTKWGDAKMCGHPTIEGTAWCAWHYVQHHVRRASS